MVKSGHLPGAVGEEIDTSKKMWVGQREKGSRREGGRGVTGRKYLTE